MTPLYELIKEEVLWKWGADGKKAFETIKQNLCDELIVMHLPDITRSFEVTTDASDMGLGAILSQYGKVLEYASQKLSKAEKNCSTTERDLLAMVWALEKWKQYCFAQSSVIYTDHRPITFLKTLKEPKRRIPRWIIRLQKYDVSLCLKSLSDHQVADFLSRLPEDLEMERLASHGTLLPTAEMVSALLFLEDPESLCRE